MPIDSQAPAPDGFTDSVAGAATGGRGPVTRMPKARSTTSDSCQGGTTASISPLSKRFSAVWTFSGNGVAWRAS